MMPEQIIFNNSPRSPKQLTTDSSTKMAKEIFPYVKELMQLNGKADRGIEEGKKSFT